MAGSTYSSNLKIELMSTGENSGTWGTITNTNLGTALEQAVVGYGNPDYLSDANLTISITNSNAAQAARALVLNVTSSFGSLSTTRELVVPTIQKQYIVQNNTTGGQSITVKTSAGTGITVPNGRKAHLYVDGTNVIQMFDFVDINGGTIDGTAIGGASAAAAAFTTLTASGATTLNGAVALGDAVGDLITVPGTINSNLLFTDNSFDIGASGATRPRDLFLSRNLVVGGTLTLAGGVNLNGNVTVGDASTDTLTINSTVTSNLIFTDNTYDIGASGATRPRSLFLAGNITAAGSQTLTGSLTVDSTTDSTSATTGSIQTDGGVGIAKALFVGTTVTVNGGTANGVAFLDGSKVLTTGSALTFDGANNFLFDASASNDQANFRVRTSTTGGVSNAYFNINGTDYFRISTESTQTGLRNLTNTPLYFSINNTEQMRLTSTGLGIGTSLPNSSLQVSGNAFIGVNTTGGVGAQTGLAVIGGATVSSGSPGTLTLGSHLNARAIGDQIGTINFFSNDASGGASGVQASIRGVTETSIGDAAGLYFYTGTSSALLERMRIDNAGNVGIGVNPTNAKLEVSASSGEVFRADASGGAFRIVANQTDVSLNGGSNVIQFINGSEGMRLTSTGLGIGTSSPSDKLTVVSISQFSGATIQGGTTNGASILTLKNSDSAGNWALGVYGSGISNTGNNLYIYDNVTNAVRLLINSSGNLGLGVTPSAQGATYRAINLSSSASYFSIAGQGAAACEGNLLWNARTTGDETFAYMNTGDQASRFRQAGQFSWHTAPSGTAGNAISFTQAMTLTAGGGLLVGSTSTPASGSSTILAANSGGGGVQLAHVGSGGGGLYVGLGGGGIATYTYTGAVGSESYTEAARINSSGQFFIGTTTGNAKLLVIGASGNTYLSIDSAGAGENYIAANSATIFQTAGSERARITSGGDLCVGTTSALDLAMITSVAPASRRGISAKTVTSAFGVLQLWNADTSGDNAFVDFYTEAGQSVRGSITYNRTAGLVAYNVTSDYRAKDISGPVVDSGALIDSVPVYMGKMKDATQERPMFIAHEVPAYAHTGEKDAVDADGKPVYQQMDASALIPVMWAEIQSLRARLAALESI
jgi:hypothetical protein